MIVTTTLSGTSFGRSAWQSGPPLHLSIAGRLKGDNAAATSPAAEAPAVESIFEKGGDRRYGEENREV